MGATGDLAEGVDLVVWWRVVGALAVSLLLQVGVNFANDYSDGVRGTDDVRVGPMRLVASGTASPRSVKRAALATFGLAGVIGLGMAAATSWWLLAVGAAAIAAAWGYTGGPKPYGYLGLGELFVFVFFGLVATVGTAYLALESVPEVTWVAASGVGFLACSLLVVNNLRDIPTDRGVGKQTLAVRLGRGDTQVLRRPDLCRVRVRCALGDLASVGARRPRRCSCCCSARASRDERRERPSVDSGARGHRTRADAVRRGLGYRARCRLTARAGRRCGCQLGGWAAQPWLR